MHGPTPDHANGMPSDGLALKLSPLLCATPRCRPPLIPPTQIAAVLSDPLHAHEFNWIVRTTQARLELFALYSARKGKSLANSPMLLEVGGEGFSPTCAALEPSSSHAMHTMALKFTAYVYASTSTLWPPRPDPQGLSTPWSPSPNFGPLPPPLGAHLAAVDGRCPSVHQPSRRHLHSVCGVGVGPHVPGAPDDHHHGRDRA
jgi:hypothetical protein